MQSCPSGQTSASSAIGGDDHHVRVALGVDEHEAHAGARSGSRRRRPSRPRSASPSGCRRGPRAATSCARCRRTSPRRWRTRAARPPRRPARAAAACRAEDVEGHALVVGRRPRSPQCDLPPAKGGPNHLFLIKDDLWRSVARLVTATVPDSAAWTPKAASEFSTPRAVRRHNLGVVLRHVIEHGPRSRATIAQETGLNKTTVSRLVGELIELGLLLERGIEARGTAGRPGPGGRRRAATARSRSGSRSTSTT